MIFADKMIHLRKKQGWSQEELAERLSVSRQSVSKWEGGQSLPDTERVLQIAELFGVTTDYLLKEEIEHEMYADEVTETVRRLSLAEAEEYVQIRKAAAKRIALGVFLCILSPVCLIMLNAAAPFGVLGGLTAAADLVGLVVLLMMAAAAVALFIFSGLKMAPYEYLSKETFRTENGVEEMARAEKEEFRAQYSRSVIIGVLLCIASPVPVIAGGLAGNGLLMSVLLCLTLLIVAVAVTFFIAAGVRWQSLQVLLQEGEYTRENKQLEKKRETLNGVYWMLVTAAYLAWSFAADAWMRSWIIWPIAGIVFAVIVQIHNAKHRQ